MNVGKKDFPGETKDSKDQLAAGACGIADVDGHAKPYQHGRGHSGVWRGSARAFSCQTSLNAADLQLKPHPFLRTAPGLQAKKSNVIAHLALDF
jgi:hypothetical protein